MASRPPRKRLSILHRNDEATLSVAQENSFFPLKVFALIVVAVVVQTSVAPYLTVLGAKPDVALVMVICLAMMRGPVWGASVGFAAGLLIDIALFQTLGISSFLFTLAGYFSGRYAEGVDPTSWFPPIFIVFVSTLVVQTLHAMMMFLLGIEASAGFVILRIVLPTAILNALLAAPIFVVSRSWLGGEKRHGLFTEQ
jgi:rod shape-determining protein MreD